MPINAHPEYTEAEKEFHLAQTDEDKIIALEKMISTAPKHKGAETLRVNLKSRYKKLKEKVYKEKQKAKKSGKKGIKKLEMQGVLVGLTNSGKSSIFKSLTNANPKIASYGFSTVEPEQAILNYDGCKIQIIDMPPIASEFFDFSLIHSTDTIIFVVEKIHEIPVVLESIKNSKAKKIILFNKIDLYDSETKRKITETLKSKRYKFVLTSTKTQEGIQELKDLLFSSFEKIRVYTKQPEKSIDEVDNEPVILVPNSTVQNVAEKILHGFSKNIRKTRIWGPSSKFGGQKVGLKHKLKDRDIIEFSTK